MTKRQFFDALSLRLQSLPKEELNRTITYYNEILEDYMEDGMTEQEAVAQVEDVDTIAQRILEENAAEQSAASQVVIVHKEKKRTWLIVLLAIIGFPIWFPILMAFLSVIFSVICVLFSVIITLLCIPVGLAGGAVGGICLSPIFFATGNVPKGLILLGGGLICASLTILAIFAAVYLTKWTWRLICWICRKLKGLFTRKKAVA
ncbi:MAG: DUF1700 domain-containing protein [Oscillospiraceae bacterium]|nr:DUF1700 domain-containing protein [Oscillospiraceae bacterium]